MAKGNLPACLAFTLEYEGGYVNRKDDPGGRTNFGVTQAVYDHWRRARNKTAQSVRLITKAEVEEIYEGGYWKPIRGDDLPRGPDLSVFDYGVNSGPSRSVNDAQRVVGAGVDGKMGPVTLEAVRLYPPRDFIKKHCGRRLGFVQSLKIWNTFGKGWSRRIAAVEATALSWVSTQPQLEQDAKEARDKAAGQAGGAVATGGGGVAVDQIIPDVTGFPWWLILIVVAAVAAPLIIRTAINLQRAAALSKVAKEA